MMTGRLVLAGHVRLYLILLAILWTFLAVQIAIRRNQLIQVLSDAMRSNQFTSVSRSLNNLEKSLNQFGIHAHGIMAQVANDVPPSLIAAVPAFPSLQIFSLVDPISPQIPEAVLAKISSGFGPQTGLMADVNELWMGLKQGQMLVFATIPVEDILVPYTQSGGSVRALRTRDLLNNTGLDNVLSALPPELIQELRLLLNKSGLSREGGLSGGTGIWQNEPLLNSHGIVVALVYSPVANLWFLAWEAGEEYVSQIRQMHEQVNRGGILAGLVLSLLLWGVLYLVNRNQDHLKRLHDISSVSLDFLWETDSALKFTYVSNKVYAILGYSASEILGRSLLEFLADDQGLMSLVSQNLPILGYEGKCRHKKGHWIDISITAIVMPGDGGVLGYRGSCSDITPLKQEQAKWKTLFDESPDGILLHDEEGKISACNRAFCNMVHHKEQEVKAKSIQHWLNMSFEQIGLEEREGVLTGPDSNGIAIGVKSVRLPLSSNDTVCTVVRDITQKKQVEQTLIEAREASDLANRMKSNFVANISHEIRTPMNSILGFSELIARDNQDSQLQDYCKAINAAGRQLLLLINDLLDLSRIESGKEEISLEPVNLSAVVTEIFAIFMPKLLAKHIKHRISQSQGFPQLLHLDEKRIRQVLFNLIGNAVKFTDQGHVQCHLTYEGDILTIAIIDSGTGIPLQDQERVFQMFEQQEIHRNQAEGSGLGLAISQKLVHLMGGSISLVSEENKGSTFTVSLTGVKEVLEPIPSVQLGLPETVVTSNWRILIIEDNRINLAMLCGFLRPTGAQLVEAKNGEDALELLSSCEFDLVLLDFILPDMNGRELIERLHALQIRLPRIVVITAAAEAMVRELLKNYAVAKYLPKPVSRQQILTLLSELQKAESEPMDSGLDSEQLASLYEELQNCLPIVEECLAKRKVTLFRKLAQNLKRLENEFPWPALKNFVRSYETHLSSFNVAQVNQHLSEFSGLVDHCLSQIKS